jgi:3-methyladenine DNA glycosylase AlkC
LKFTRTGRQRSLLLTKVEVAEKVHPSEQERQSAQSILACLLEKRTAQGLDELRALADAIHAAIPARQRISRGITWVLQRVSCLLALECEGAGQIRSIADALYTNLAPDDRLMGVPIFLMAEYGKGTGLANPADVLEFFLRMAGSGDWVVREFAAAGFHKLIGPCRGVALPWLKEIVQSEDPNLRRFASETLRPVTDNQWLNKEPGTSLEILRYLFREAHPYPRTSVGNNLSDLARRNPDLILGIVKELVASGDKNSYWIAYRACRNMVKQDPQGIMDILGVDEYHYKDRIYYRANDGEEV